MQQDQIHQTKQIHQETRTGRTLPKTQEITTTKIQGEKAPEMGFLRSFPTQKYQSKLRNVIPSEKIGIHNLTSFSLEKALPADVWAEILKYPYKGHNGSLSSILAP